MTGQNTDSLIIKYQTLDTISSQSRLSYLNGKTLYLNYNYLGLQDYNETISFTKAPSYSDYYGRYLIVGKRNNSTDINCFSDEKDSDHVVIDGTLYMYDCPDFFASGSKDLFAFNINADATLSGYYEYVQAGLNAYEEISTPDAELSSSYIKDTSKNLK
jgi:hypothetical protein